jgi:hypothetical protein
MTMPNWSERLDARIMAFMRHVPAPPLWLLVLLQLIAVALGIYGFFVFFWLAA